MVRKKLAIAVLAISALQANFASAMGLGNLSIKSALNQPLNAEIKLLDTGDLDPTQIKVQLATTEDFERAGVDRDYFLTNLQFTVSMDGQGGGVIRVSTREPVIEPYLNFVIEARWPNGRLLREFAVLLDPPTFGANRAPTPVAPATSSGIATVQNAKKTQVQPPTVSTETETSAAAPSGDMSMPGTGTPGEYRIQAYDTLSKIAVRHKPASDVSVAQTMLAIQRANPHAFINNNVNLIKSGYVVRLPNADEVRGISADQAAQEVESQTSSWRSGSASSATTASASGPQLDASAPEPAAKEGGYREQARLSIAAPTDATKSAGSGSGGGKAVEALRSELAASQEALEKGKRDNGELQSRLDDMERQIATLQRLISLKDDQLAALQAKSADSAPATQAPAATTEQPAPGAGVAPSDAPATDAAATQPSAQPQPAPAPKPAAQPAVKAVPKPAPEPSLLDRIMAQPLYLAAAAGALLLALIGFIVAKRRRDAEETEESNDFTFDDDNTFPFHNTDLDNASISDDAITPNNEVQHDFEAPEAPAADAVSAPSMQPQTGDPIAESDIYIAYGRYQQAVDLLTNAIDAEPNRSDLRVKLLEVYIEMRDREAFRQQFIGLQSLGDSDAIAKIKDTLSSVDGVSDWLSDVPGASNSWSMGATSTAAVAAGGWAYQEMTKSDDADEHAAQLESSEESALDLDLDLDDDFEATTTLNDPDFAPSSAQAEAELDLDLDLDDDFAAIETGTLEAETPTAPIAQASTFESSTDNSFDEGLELDLGDDDLDRALSEMATTGELGDLEVMADSLKDIDLSPAPMAEERDLDADLSTAFATTDLSATDLSTNELSTNDLADSFDAELDGDLELPDEFDLSSAGEELPDIERTDFDFDSSFGELELPDEAPAQQADTFAASTFESTLEASTFDAPASFEAPAPAPVEAPAAFETAAPESAPTLDSSDDFDFLADTDEIATKLDLARAYIDMGDTDGARDILDEVLQEGTDTQKQDASSLLSRIG